MRILSFLLATSVCFADIANHRYKQGELVELWVNKVKHIDIDALQKGLSLSV
jgi:hypothetical protein